ncbi:hypothetical protein [Methylococcus mesophilus]|uniref:hypothetical protein n=1 Tax=Methylococcus mesophilus TaxID=2993564 RepID=UPI00224A63C2|nr:hypothetical protein [Methylococcus mesophilus]UZR28126.1 hypothetical protein OOT43_15610 [Methylococcus mesophilus]
MPSLTPPERLSSAQRVHEITTILAAAILRTYLIEPEKKTGLDLGLLAGKRVHTTPSQPERV